MTTQKDELIAEFRSVMVDWLHLRAIQQYGRRVIYRPQGEWEGFALSFRPDGTGFAEGQGRPISFTWRDEPVSVNELEAMTEDELLGVGRRVFEEQVAGALSDPYVVDMSQFAERLTFTSGSRADLENVTRWIAHANPEMFGSGDKIEITYQAALDGQSGGLQARGLNIPDRVRNLLDLAFDQNAFTGIYWEFDDRGSRRVSDFRRRPGRVIVSVNAPSAHERAEAMLELWQWLEGKVEDGERRRLLGRT